jgi:hypothetical protein
MSGDDVRLLYFCFIKHHTTYKLIDGVVYMVYRSQYGPQQLRSVWDGILNDYLPKDT